MNGGAVAYLTHSKAGRNGTEVTINNSSTYITGNAGNTVSASSASGTTNAYNTAAGQLASSTGNITGIYDLSGGAYEYTAAYNASYSRTGSYYGGTGGNTDATYKPASGSHFAYTLNGSSSKYATAYTNATSTNYGSTVSTVCKTGDAVKEVWVSTNYGWFSDSSLFVDTVDPFFKRGGHYAGGSSAGVFYSCYSNR